MALSASGEVGQSLQIGGRENADQSACTPAQPFIQCQKWTIQLHRKSHIFGVVRLRPSQSLGNIPRVFDGRQRVKLEWELSKAPPCNTGDVLRNLSPPVQLVQG